MKPIFPLFVISLTIFTSAVAQNFGDPDGLEPAPKEYSPFLNHDYPGRVFFGDTTCHTSYSADAGMFGSNLGPEKAYRFAKGEVVKSSSGVRSRLIKPLDWIVLVAKWHSHPGLPGRSQENRKLHSTKLYSR